MGQKSGKPWWRARNMVLLVAAAVVVLIGQGVFRASVSSPGQGRDYAQQLYDAVAAAQRPGVDGWPALAAALQSLQEFEQRERDEHGARPPEWWPTGVGWPVDFLPVRDAGADPQVVAFVVEQMRRLQASDLGDHLALAAGSPRAVRPKFEETPLMEILLPELQPARQLARYQAARMFLGGRTGDADQVVEAFEQTLAVGRMLMGQATIVDRLVGMAIINLVLSELKLQLGEGLVDGATARRLLEAIDRQLGPGCTPTLALQAASARLWIMDVLDRVYTEHPRGDGRLVLTALAPYAELWGLDVPTSPRAVNMLGMFMPRKREVVAKLDEAAFKVTEATQVAWPVAAARVGEVDMAMELLPRGYFLLRQLWPAMSHAFRLDVDHRLQVQGVRIMLALEIHRAEHGEYPGRLEDLAPRILPELPLDPVSRESFRIRVLSPDEQAIAGWSYILYSIGVDGLDNDGVEDAAGKYNALYQRGAGTDFIINDATR